MDATSISLLAFDYAYSFDFLTSQDLVENELLCEDGYERSLHRINHGKVIRPTSLTPHNEEHSIVPRPLSLGKRTKALFVGINYASSSVPLRGCRNDALYLTRKLQSTIRFDEIVILIDDPHLPRQPTAENILIELSRLCEGARPGDVLLFHFSGHGTQIENLTGSEVDGLDECLVGSDFNLIMDNDIKDFVNKLPPGVNFTFLADCCHSGTLLDFDQCQISHSQIRSPFNQPSLPPTETVHRGISFEQLRQCFFARNKKLFRSKQLNVSSDTRSSVNKGILFSACRDHEKSADFFSQKFRRHHGALTSSLLLIPNRLQSLTNQELFKKINAEFKVLGFPQNAMLSCDSEANTLGFLKSFC